MTITVVIPSNIIQLLQGKYPGISERQIRLISSNWVMTQLHDNVNPDADGMFEEWLNDNEDGINDILKEKE
jgi:hypothetical protein